MPNHFHKHDSRLHKHMINTYKKNNRLAELSKPIIYEQQHEKVLSETSYSKETGACYRYRTCTYTHARNNSPYKNSNESSYSFSFKPIILISKFASFNILSNTSINTPFSFTISTLYSPVSFEFPPHLLDMQVLS